MRLSKLLGLGLAALALAALVPAAPAAIIINEVDSDTVNTPTTDVSEFLELYSTTGGTTSLDGLVLVMYNGNGNRAYYVQDLDGFSTSASGYFVAGSTGVPNLGLTIAGNTIQNGADAIAIYLGNGTDFTTGASGTLSTAQPAGTTLLDAVVYKTGPDLDGGTLVSSLLLAGAEVDEFGRDGTATAGAADSIGRFPNGGGNVRDTSTGWAVLVPTPGATNQPVPEPASAGLAAVAAGLLSLRRRR